MEFKTITFTEPEPGIALLTLNRPRRLNALCMEMLDELYAMIAELRQRNETRVLIVTGEGRGFCSGADLKDDYFATEEGMKLFSAASYHLESVQKKYAGIIIELKRLTQPIISAVNGPAAGGGMCLALVADVIIAGPNASFTPSFINIGLSGGEFGSTYFLPRLVGTARASEILMTGRTVGAEEADRIGIVSRLVKEEDRLMPEAFETARIMLSKTPLGLKLTKEALVQNSHASSLEAAIELENRNQSITCCTPEFFNAVTAFVKKEK
jgi:enoyl-CoA hydratase